MVNARVYVVAAALVAFGLSVAIARVQLTDTPLVPEQTQHVWEVELEADLTGRGRGKVQVHLPGTGPGQVVFDGQPHGEPLEWTHRKDELGQQVATWRGRPATGTVLRYRLRLQTLPLELLLPAAPTRSRIPEVVRDRFLKAPSDEALDEVLKRLEMPPKDDPSARARALFAFVAERVATEALGPNEPIQTLVERYGSPLGKARLLTVLARRVGIPARTVLGLRADRVAGAEADDAAWVEMWIGEGWIPMDPTRRFFGERPRDLIALRIGDGEATTFVDAFGRVEIAGHRARVSPVRYSHRLEADELVPEHPFFGRFSLYALPLSTQSALRVLLLLPLGALVVSVARVGIGLKTFGGFLPVLLAIAFRDSSLIVGLGLSAGLVVLGIFGRTVLGPLNLLHFPRSALILCLVVLGVMSTALLGHYLDTNELLAGVFFPIVITSLLIERFSLTLEEEGLRPALGRAFTTGVVITLVYPVLNLSLLTYLLFSFPELLFVVMGLLVAVGGYTGYRLLDYWRFRHLMAESDEQSGSVAETHP